MKDVFSVFISLVSLILLVLLILIIIMILLLIDLTTINDVVYPPTYYSLYSSDLNIFHLDYGSNNNNSIFNPFLDLFYKNNYYPSYFIKENVRLNYPHSNLSLVDIIFNRQYHMLDKTYNNLNELSSDLNEIVKEYRNGVFKS